MEKNIGITGQAGFIGTHLSNYLRLKTDECTQIPFEDCYFDHEAKLDEFIHDCDVIVHLAGMNRHEDQNVIYQTNIELIKKLIASMDRLNHHPHILFSSSTQEERDNMYGKSKKDGRGLLARNAREHQSVFSGLIIPNVFGPFGLPFYNSVVATFCYQLAHDKQPQIDIDADLDLIYVNNLVKIIYDIIQKQFNHQEIRIKPDKTLKVSDILAKLQDYKAVYLEKNIIPKFNTRFETALFNTYRSFIDHDHYPVPLDVRSDHRGHLIELLKSHVGGQVFYSATKPGITRGNHYHRRKIERFCVLQGDALIKLRKISTNEVIDYHVTGHRPATIDMPIFYTHNIKNIGDSDLLTLFWTNELYDPDDPDTYYEEV